MVSVQRFWRRTIRQKNRYVHTFFRMDCIKGVLLINAKYIMDAYMPVCIYVGKRNKDVLKERSRAAHVKWGNKWLNATSDKERQAINKLKGYKYCGFLRLRYFHPSMMAPIDPMHCLWQGVAKAIIATFKKEEILTKANMRLMETRIKKLHLPSSMSTLRGKVKTMSGFTAAEMKHFVLFLSQVRHMLLL